MPTNIQTSIEAKGSRVLLVGAGGHGKVVADALQAGVSNQHLCFVDDCEDLWGQNLMGLPILGALSAVLRTGDRVHVAIGSNLIRERVAGSVDFGQLLTVLHPQSLISKHALVDTGSFIAAGAVVGPCVQLGRGVIVNHGAVIDHDCHVGDFCHVAPLASLAGDVRLGAGVLVGAGANILPGIKIGAWAVIGAGAVVTRDVAAGVTVVGVPACERKKLAHG